MTVSTIQLTDDLTFSRLVPGLWRLEDWHYTPDQLLGWIKGCLDLGMTTFDHADVYGGFTSEGDFGDALALDPALRGKIQLVTKCGILFPAATHTDVAHKHYNTSTDYIISAAERSLRKLRTDYIDLLLIHRADVLMNPDEVAAAFTQLKDAGKVLHFGVSNHSASQMALLQSRLDFPLVTNQVEYSVMHLEPLHDGTFDYMQQHQVKPMAWSPLGGGGIFRGDTEQARRLQTGLNAVGEELGGAPIDQVAIAWILTHPAQVIPVLGSRQLERLQSAAEAEKLTLTREQWFRIWAASTGHEVP